MVEIKKEKDNSYSFSVKTTSGSTILNSIIFSSEQEIKKTFNDLYPNIDNENIFERKTNHNGKFLFHLKNITGSIIGNSQLYNSEAGMENGIKNTRKSITHQY